MWIRLSPSTSKVMATAQRALLGQGTGLLIRSMSFSAKRDWPQGRPAGPIEKLEKSQSFAYGKSMGGVRITVSSRSVLVFTAIDMDGLATDVLGEIGCQEQIAPDDIAGREMSRDR